MDVGTTQWCVRCACMCCTDVGSEEPLSCRKLIGDQRDSQCVTAMMMQH